MAVLPCPIKGPYTEGLGGKRLQEDITHILGQLNCIVRLEAYIKGGIRGGSTGNKKYLLGLSHSMNNDYFGVTLSST